jgi:oligoribonuclease NrnB/cAMP/cGMP phosphodiesterase (DHH superfamily)
MSERIVIYHANCPDGFTAAWVASTVREWREAAFVESQYGDAPPDVTDKHVLILDFSYPRAVLLEMAAKAKSIRVLDHHKSAQKELAGLDFCTFDMDRSGAAMAWDALRGGDPRPMLVELVQDRDLWRWRVSASRELNAWISVHQRTFDEWSMLDNRLQHGAERADVSSRDRYAERGGAILKHVDAYVESTAKNVRRYMVGGEPIPFINTPGMMASELIGKIAESAPYAVGWFERADGKVQYSLRSRGEFDVSVVAERFGGGGHKQAAGFEATDYPGQLFTPAEES